MRTLGLYVSDPTEYVPQTFCFAEPAYFFLDRDNIIRYSDLSSHPMGGRINIDNLLGGLAYVQGRINDEKDTFNKKYIWGNK